MRLRLLKLMLGIAMGTGTDVAIESAGITLLGGDISKLVKAIKLSKITMRGNQAKSFLGIRLQHCRYTTCRRCFSIQSSVGF